MIFSSTIAGDDQSMCFSTRNPRLNQEEKRWTKSRSTAARSARLVSASSRLARMDTSVSVPSGARLRRRTISCRRGSLASCNSASASSLPASIYFCAGLLQPLAVRAETVR
jgi:hypothetical protein